MGGAERRARVSPRPPTVVLLAGLQGSGKTTAPASSPATPGAGPSLAARRLRRLPPRRRRAARQRRRAARHPVSTEQGIDRCRSRSPTRGVARGEAPRARTCVIVDTAGRLHVDERADGRARDDQRRRSSPTHILLVARRDDRSGRRRGRRGVPGAVALRRRDPDQARRRRARRRGALGPRDHRQADLVRLDRREARRARALPSGPDGAAHPRHGRRAEPDREGAGRLSTRSGGRTRAQAAQAASSTSTTSSISCGRSARWARCRACSG